MIEIHTLPHRSEVPTAEIWNLASIYPTPADWEAACRDLAGRLPDLAAYAGKLGESPATLAAYLAQFQDAGIAMGKIVTYTSNGATVDTGDQRGRGAAPPGGVHPEDLQAAGAGRAVPGWPGVQREHLGQRDTARAPHLGD